MTQGAVYHGASNGTSSGAAGAAKMTLTDLPSEILLQITSDVYAAHQHQDLKAHLSWFVRTVPLINKKFGTLSKEYVYRYFIFTNPRTFNALHGSLRSTEQGPAGYVRCLDLQEFSLDHIYDEGEVDSQALLNFLSDAGNLQEVLFSFALDYSLNKEILYHLFFAPNRIEAIDFSGLTEESSKIFLELVEDFRSVAASHNNNIDCSNLKYLSFHDSQSIPGEFFDTLFPYLTNIKRLDLANIKVSDDSACRLPAFSNLTHLSLSCCNLTKHRIFDYFTNQKSLRYTLKWLNLESDFYTNTLSEDELLIILESLTPTTENGASGVNTALQYLNLNGRSVTYRVLEFIKERFFSLQALHIYKSTVSVQELVTFLSPPDLDNVSVSSLESASLSRSYQKLKYLNVAGNPNITADAIRQGEPSLIECCPSMICFEFSPFICNRISSSGIKTGLNETWKVAKCQYRAWLYKVLEELDSPASFGVKMKTNKGQELINHPFIKYAYNKIEISKGLDKSHSNDTWPVRVSEKSIYNEYALNSGMYF